MIVYIRDWYIIMHIEGCKHFLQANFKGTIFRFLKISFSPQYIILNLELLSLSFK